jgi:hypothetical protein
MAQEPQIQNLDRLVDVIIKVIEPNSTEGRKVNDKSIVVGVQWILLEERKRSLNTASGSSRQYSSNLGLLQGALHKTGDSLGDVASEKNAS